MTKTVIQRSQTYQVHAEVYHLSEKQQEIRKEMTFNVKTRLDFQSNSKNARMSRNLILDGQRGVRAAQSRTLADGTPSPATWWSG